VTTLDIARAAAEQRFSTSHVRLRLRLSTTTPMTGHAETSRGYLRELPGQGFVAIEVKQEFSLLRGWHFRGSLVVERRAASRRPGHSPPVIAEATGKSMESVIQQLLPTAECNPAIGAAVLRMQRSSEDEYVSRR